MRIWISVLYHKIIFCMKVFLKLKYRALLKFMAAVIIKKYFNIRAEITETHFVKFPANILPII